MKTSPKPLRIIFPFVLVMMFVSPSFAQSPFGNPRSNDLEMSTVDMIRAKIDRMRYQLAELRDMPTHHMGRHELKMHKRRIRHLRANIAEERELLSRLTTPYFGPYAGWNNPYYFNPYRGNVLPPPRVRNVVIAPRGTCPPPQSPIGQVPPGNRRIKP